jgi:Fe-S cluster biogenesis protein NfuA
MNMFIQTENTPNPATLKFLPGCTVMENGTANFTSQDESNSSPLALSLFNTPGVTGVFLGADFITLTKTDDRDWDLLKPLVLGAIMEHFQSGRPVMTELSASDGSQDSEEDDSVIRQIKDLIDTRVRPAVAQDGGDIVYKGFEEGVVYLQMQGACSGCPSSTATLKGGIENMLRHYVPEVEEVRAV